MKSKTHSPSAATRWESRSRDEVYKEKIAFNFDICYKTVVVAIFIFATMQTQLKQELYDVISGKSEVRFGTTIQSIASYLAKGSKPSSEIENSKYFKEEEAKKLVSYVTENELWINDIDLTQYISEGAEQKVYLKSSEHVVKLEVWRPFRAF